MPRSFVETVFQKQLEDYDDFKWRLKLAAGTILALCVFSIILHYAQYSWMETLRAEVQDLKKIVEEPVVIVQDGDVGDDFRGCTELPESTEFSSEF